MVEDARLPALVELQQASQIPHLHHHLQPKLGDQATGAPLPACGSLAGIACRNVK
jgi:hypothetical protein